VTVAALHRLITLLMHIYVGCALDLAVEPASALTMDTIKPSAIGPHRRTEQVLMAPMPLLQQLHWLSVRQCVIFKLAGMVHQSWLEWHHHT